MSQITITVTGPTKSGKSLIKYQIASYLKNIGLDVTVIENELNERAVQDRVDNPAKYVKALNEDGLTIKVQEQQLDRLGIYNT